MGIKSINSFLNRLCPQAFKVIALSFAYGQSLGIDGYNWLYTLFAIATKELLRYQTDPLEPLDRRSVLNYVAHRVVSNLLLFLRAGVRPSLFWDGEAGIEKTHEREKRKKAKDDQRQRIAHKRAELEALHPLARTPALLGEYKSLLANLTTVSREEIDYLKGLIRGLGFPSFDAQGEGEKLAAACALEGLVAGVWSQDTDNYPLGTPILVTGFEGTNAEGLPLVSVVSQAEILEGLSRDAGRPITQAEFVDFCILCGTDFNDNIPGIGPVKAWQLIKTHGSFENIEAKCPEIPVGTLNYQRSRAKFAYEPSPCRQAPELLDFNLTAFEGAKDLAAFYTVEGPYLDLQQAVRALPPKPARKRRLRIVDS